MKSFKLALFFLAGTLLFSCSDEASVEEIKTEFIGPSINIGDGQAWTVINTDENQIPQSIGIQFTEGALNNLPTGSMHADEFLLNLPTEINVAPYDHITLDWNEHGHPPMHVYDLPHFDIHFYFMSDNERDQIGPFDSMEFNMPMAPEYLAPMYLETPGGVPRMGAHIIDLLSPEVAGTGTFTHTFIYGKYKAKMNFLEPMVTKGFLDSRQSVVKEIRHPQKWQQDGYYPDGYSIQYDEGSGIYSILLENLKKY